MNRIAQHLKPKCSFCQSPLVNWRCPQCMPNTTGGLCESDLRAAIERSDTLAPLDHPHTCECPACENCEPIPAPPIRVTVGSDRAQVGSVDDIEQAAYLMGWHDGSKGDSRAWIGAAFILGLVVGLWWR